MAKLTLQLTSSLQKLKAYFSPYFKDTLIGYTGFCASLLRNNFQKPLYRIPKGVAFAIKDQAGEVSVFLFIPEFEKFFNNNNLGIMELGFASTQGSLWLSIKNKNINDVFERDNCKYTIVYRTQPPKIHTHPIHINPQKVLKNKPRKGRKNKKRKEGYKETDTERRERVRSFMSPIYQPIGLGKRR